MNLFVSFEYTVIWNNHSSPDIGIDNLVLFDRGAPKSLDDFDSLVNEVNAQYGIGNSATVLTRIITWHEIPND